MRKLILKPFQNVSNDFLLRAFDIFVIEHVRTRALMTQTFSGSDFESLDSGLEKRARTHF